MIELNNKQKEAFKMLTDQNGKEIIVYGNAAGGGKSLLGAYWLVYNCLKYHNSVWLCGMANLKDCATKLLSQFRKAHNHFEEKSKKKIDYRYDKGTNTIFVGESQIIFVNLEYNASDPEFNSLNGYNACGVWVDEAQQITEKSWETLLFRIRQNEDYGIQGKCLVTLNPQNNWVKSRFWEPYCTGTLPDTFTFITATFEDNIDNLPADYINKFNNASEQTRKRMLGNWDYDNASDNLLEEDKIETMFDAGLSYRTNKKYLSVDVAGSGDDLSTFMVWDGMTCIDICYELKSTDVSIKSMIQKLMLTYAIPKHNLIIDTTGIGAFIGDYFTSCVKFQSGGKVLNDENFYNLRAQVFYKLRDFAFNFDTNSIQINIKGKSIQTRIREELAAIKLDTTTDKIRILDKKSIKKNLGRSPDFADNIAMRMYFEIRKKNNNNMTFYVI